MRAPGRVALALATAFLGACSTVWGFENLVAGDAGIAGGDATSGDALSPDAAADGPGDHDAGAEAGPLDAGVDAPRGDAAAAPSCAPGGAGLTNCGAGSESCCTSLEVPSGTYFRTYGFDGGTPTGEADPATVSGFRLDKYEVTVGRFRQFVSTWNGGAWTPPVGSGKHTHLNGGRGLANSANPGTFETGWLSSDNSNIAPTDGNLVCDPNYATWTTSAGSHENLPINCPNWYEAQAFCIWDGGFLPSEAEWVYVAAGGSDQLEYPWGSTDPGTGNLYAIHGNGMSSVCDYPDGGSCMGVVNLAPVGTATLGAGLWHQLDLAGNVNEWALDWYVASYVDPCADCAYLTAPPVSPPNLNHVIHGGSFYDGLADILPTSRPVVVSPLALHDFYFGFRCARTS